MNFVSVILGELDGLLDAKRMTEFSSSAADTLQNCTLELATLGDLKLVEKPTPLVLGPHDFANIKANVKVSSTENGIIFGNIGKVLMFSFSIFLFLFFDKNSVSCYPKSYSLVSSQF